MGLIKPLYAIGPSRRGCFTLVGCPVRAWSSLENLYLKRFLVLQVIWSAHWDKIENSELYVGDFGSFTAVLVASILFATHAHFAIIYHRLIVLSKTEKETNIRRWDQKPYDDVICRRFPILKHLLFLFIRKK